MECSYISAPKRENILFQFAVKYLHQRQNTLKNWDFKKKKRPNFKLLHLKN